MVSPSRLTPSQAARASSSVLPATKREEKLLATEEVSMKRRSRALRERKRKKLRTGVSSIVHTGGSGGQITECTEGVIRQASKLGGLGVEFAPITGSRD